MNLGLVSVSFRNESVHRIIEESCKAGLSCIEWGSDVHAPHNDHRQLAEIVRLQKETGMECSSYGTYFRLGCNRPDELLSYIDAARILGTTMLRLWCGQKGSREYTENERHALFDECCKAAEIAAENNVILCMECHNNTFTDEREAALELMGAVNSPNFQMYWQPNQFKSDEENKAYARLIAHYTKVIHVFNWEGAKHNPLREAIPLWKEYLSCFNGEQALLLEFMPDNNIASLAEEARALREIAGGIL